jgi:hypothetical protein
MTGLLEKVINVFTEAERHRRKAAEDRQQDQMLAEALADAEQQRADVIRIAARRRETRGEDASQLHRLANDIEGRALLYREMGMEQEEFEILTEH